MLSLKQIKIMSKKTRLTSSSIKPISVVLSSSLQSSKIVGKRLADKDTQVFVYEDYIERTISSSKGEKPKNLNMINLRVNGEKVGHIGYIEGKICNLKVLPKFRGKGYAAKLIDKVIKRLSTGLIYLEARPYGDKEGMSLKELVGFYSTFGFVPLPEEFQKKFNTVYMVKIVGE